MPPADRFLPAQSVEFRIIWRWVTWDQLEVLYIGHPTFDREEMMDSWNHVMRNTPDNCCLVEIEPQKFVWYQWRPVPFLLVQ